MIVGSTISHYRIVEKLGEGGMGVVYKAEDTRLERFVAIKFLRDRTLNNEQVRKRFRREAKAAAALSHANVCTVYEIDEVDGNTFIVMELIEADSLDQKIDNGPLDLQEVLQVSRQITKGLEAAHKTGIVHRDIKPQNIMVDSDGHVTIMDFGLAQLSQASSLTRTDQAVGTTAYMSPEQTHGTGTDHRTDLWSLGVVIYEMTSGQRPFRGDYAEAVMYSIVNEDPEPLTAMRTGVPLELELCVVKCLAKDRAMRYQHADELIVDLESILSKLERGSSRTYSSSLSQRSEQPAERSWMLRLSWLLSVLLALSLGAILWSWPEPGNGAGAAVRRFSFALSSAEFPAVSPNGVHVAYESAGRLWVQDLDQDEPRLISDAGERPFWSPGNRFVGFASDGRLWRVPVQGGAADLVCDLPGAYSGGSWSPGGESIIFSAYSSETDGVALFEVPARGGTAQPIVLPEESADGIRVFPYAPSFLPTPSRRLLAYAVGTTEDEGTKLVVQDLEADNKQVLLDGGGPALTIDGYLVFVDAEDRLWTLPLSTATLLPAGEAFPIASLGVSPSVAADGTLVYLAPSQQNRRLVWYDRSGQRLRPVGQPQPEISFPDLSADGAFAIATGSGDVWFHDLERDVATNLTLSPEAERYPAWAPWGAVFYREEDVLFRPFGLLREAELLIGGSGRQYIYDIDQSGRHIVYGDRRDGPYDIWRLERADDGALSEPQLYFGSPSETVDAQLSPEGRYIAYSSRPSVTDEWDVFVQPFPEGGPQIKISADGGAQVRWSPRGDELFYVKDGSLFVVGVTTSPEFRAGRPARLFTIPALRYPIARPTYAVAPDGSRFLLVEPDPEADAAPARIRIVQNWYEEFRDRGE